MFGDSKDRHYRDHTDRLLVIRGYGASNRPPWLKLTSIRYVLDFDVNKDGNINPIDVLRVTKQ
jgi:hypothetical protein